MIVRMYTIGEVVIARGPGCEIGDPLHASLFTKHILAPTSRGGAASTDIEAPTRTVRERVLETFGVTLMPEPVTVGVAW